MEEEKNCLLIKYCLKRDDDDDLKRCFVLNEFYSNKFKITPIDEIEVSYLACFGYDRNYAIANSYKKYGIAKLYFIKPISTYTYNEIKRLFLVDDEEDYIINKLNK